MFDPVDAMVSNFERYHQYFQTRVAPGWQVPASHRRAIALRGQRPATEAIADTGFMDCLLQALAEDFRLARTRLHNPLVVAPALYPTIQKLDGIRLEDVTRANLDDLWQVVEGLDLHGAKAKVVANSKALAHVLTELVVPIDRTYTGAFLFRFAREFDNRQDEKGLFYTAFYAFRSIAQRVDLARYVSSNANDWNTTRPKVIDNAIIGFVERARAELRAKL